MKVLQKVLQWLKSATALCAFVLVLVFPFVAFATGGIPAGIGVLIFYALAVLFFYNAAKNKQQASFVKQSTIEFVVAGETCVRVLENIRGWHYEEGPCWFPYQKKVGVNLDGSPQIADDWEEVYDAIVPDKRGPTGHQNGASRSSWLEKNLGIFWVSLLYPLRHIFSFPVAHLRLKSETAIPTGTPLEQWLDSSVKDSNGVAINGDTTEERFLLWKFPRPVLVREVEFTDLFEANILILAYFQIVSPEPLVFEYREKFFLLLEKAIQAAVIDYLRKKDYKSFVSSGATGPLSTFFWDAMEGINWTGKTAESRRGLVKEFGVYLQDAWVVQIELSEADTDATKALKAKKIAELVGDAEIATAKRHAKAVVTVANADAEALTKQLAAVAAHPEVLTGKFAVDIARLQIEKAAAIKSGVVWVEGGGNTLLTIPATPSSARPPVPPTP